MLTSTPSHASSSSFSSKNIHSISTTLEYQSLLKEYRSTHHIITLATFTKEQETSHKCLHCKLYRDLLVKYVESFPNDIKGILVEFTPQSQQFVIETLHLTHLPSISIQSKFNDLKPYECNLRETQMWDCVKIALKDDDELSEELNHFIDLEFVKELYTKYQAEFEKSSDSSTGGGGSSSQSLFSILSSLSKIFLIGFVITGFIIGISTLQSLLPFGKYALFMLCILIYIVCMAGTVFNAIQNPPPYQFNPYEKSITFFYPSMRMSFALEGYFAMVVVVVSAFYFIAIPYSGMKKSETTNDQKNYSTSSSLNHGGETTTRGNNTTTLTTTTTSTRTSSTKSKKKTEKATSVTTTSSSSSSVQSRSSSASSMEQMEDEDNQESNNESDTASYLWQIIKRTFFIWGFFFTFWAAMIFFMIKTSFYLSETPYHFIVQLLLDIFNK
ncbi:hypothetical protein FDP41_010855 [Naegleria fowleri]|uniref:Thioredoxin domain-containing protein n=1 Tax=Naegleria fowleri TaxID=5763 RepID=A0A6A5C545_NAEFO|nr:uncharacterized protein FDP41_010855 [Naegleria fowleri]KAF0982876.1 hypothetical protein FDP41_010855 [Naegleria fowleri]CAG4719679.1 unnamed protein product [Naegleria fowleri]